MSRSSGFLQYAIFTSIAVFAAGSSRTAFATCGDYLQHSGQFAAQLRELQLLMPGNLPVRFPSKCPGGRCRNTPEKSPLGTAPSEFRVRIRTGSTLEDLLQPAGEKDRSNRLLPHSDSAPEPVSLDQLDPPPRS